MKKLAKQAKGRPNKLSTDILKLKEKAPLG
jgi:hypothetical protein